MATKDAPTGPQTQKQTASGEADFKADNAPEKNTDEIQFFDTTVTKLVERENADGDKEWVEVLSDNLYPGEKLKRELDEEKLAEKQKAARKAATEAAEDRKDKK